MFRGHRHQQRPSTLDNISEAVRGQANASPYKKVFDHWLYESSQLSDLALGVQRPDVYK